MNKYDWSRWVRKPGTVLCIVCAMSCLVLSLVVATQHREAALATDRLQGVVNSQLTTQQELLEYVKKLEARVADLEKAAAAKDDDKDGASNSASGDAAKPQPKSPEHGDAAPTGILYDCLISYYCAEQYAHICNNGPPYGVTASGATLTPYLTCAVDPRVIPLGSEVVVEFEDGTKWHLLAQDTGGAIDGSRIDIAVSTHDEALKLGLDRATVRWYG